MAADWGCASCGSRRHLHLHLHLRLLRLLHLRRTATAATSTLPSASGGASYGPASPRSDVVFDAVALYLSLHPHDGDAFQIQQVALEVTAAGATRRVSTGGKTVSAALRWRDAAALQAFFRDLARVDPR